MTPEEMQGFQDKLRQDFSHTIRVRVEKPLTPEEREALINHIRYTRNDFNASIEIIEPIPIDFDFEVLPFEEEIQKPIQSPQNASSDASSTTSDKKDDSNWVYGPNWIVLQNRLLNAITDLTHNERRLIMLLSPKVRAAVDKNANQRTFMLTASEFAKEYGLEKDGTYQLLSELSDSLLQKAFWFYDFKADEVVNRKGSSWVAECEYLKGQGRIAVTLTDTVTEMLTVFDKSNTFTKYERRYIVELGSYGILMFELVSSCLHLQGGKKAYSVAYLRQKFNCTDKYEKITDFKTKVLGKAIAEVEKHTPLKVSYTENKIGREISEIVFCIRDTSSTSLEDIVKVFSPAEIKKYGWKLKDKHEVVSNFPQSIKTPVETQKEIEARMAKPEYYAEYVRYLKKLTDFDEKLHIKNMLKRAN